MSIGWWPELLGDFALNVPVQFGFGSAPHHGAAVALNTPISLGMAGAGKSVASFGLSQTLSMGVGAGPIKWIVYDDTFDTNTNWTYTGSAVVSGGQLSVPVTPVSQAFSRSTYNMSDSRVEMELVSVPNTPTGSGNTAYSCIIIYEPARTGYHYSMYWYASNGFVSLLMRETINGVLSDASITFDPVAHKWFRMRADSTTWYWETSPDGITWTTRRSRPLSTVNLTDLKVWMASNKTGTDFGGQGVWDNFRFRPYPVGPTFAATLGLNQTLGLTFAAAEHYARTYTVNTPVSLDFVGGSRNPASMAINCPISLGFTGVGKAPPNISSVSPSTGDYDTTVTISGTNLLSKSVTLDDTFDSSTNWNLTGLAPSITGGQLVFGPGIGTSNAIQSAAGSSFVNNAVQGEVMEVATPSTGSGNYSYLTMLVYNTADQTDYWAIYHYTNGGINGGVPNLLMREAVNNVLSDTTIPYDAVAHKFWRLREESGTMYWETSPTGADNTWTVRRSKAIDAGVPITSVRAWFQTNRGGTVDAGGSYKVDNFKRHLWSPNITIGGQAVRNATGTPTSVTCNPPGLNNGNYDVVATNTDGSDTETNGFTYSFTEISEIDVTRSGFAWPTGSKGVWVDEVIGGGGRGGRGASNTTAGTVKAGGGGGGGGAGISKTDAYIPRPSGSPTYSTTIGLGGTTTGANGGSSQFATTGITLTASGGNAGGSSSGTSGGTGGTGGTATVSGTTATSSNGGTGRTGATTAKPAKAAGTTGPGAPGGGGGGSIDSAAAIISGGDGGDSSYATGGLGNAGGSAAAGGTGGNGSPTGNPGGGGGGSGGRHSVNGPGGPGGTYGAGGGGSAGNDSATPGQAEGGSGANGTVRLRFV